MAAQGAGAEPVRDLVWLDVAPELLSTHQSQELEMLLRQGLRRRGLDMSSEGAAHALWVVEVRSIQTELFVLVAPGPALPGSGISKSRRIDTAKLTPDLLPLGLAQAAEELLDAAREIVPAPAPLAAQAPTPVSPPSPSPSAAPMDSAPPAFSTAAGPRLDLYSGGVTAIGGAIELELFAAWFGLRAGAFLGNVLDTESSAGRVDGLSVALRLGPAARAALLPGLILSFAAPLEARLLRASGRDPTEGLEGRAIDAWIFSALGAIRLDLGISDRLGLRAEGAVGPVLRGAWLESRGQHLLGATGVETSFYLAMSWAP